MRGRLKILGLVAGAIAAAGVGAGAVAATQGGGDPAADLASAINKRAGTNITSADVQGAFKDLLKARLDADVVAGRLTQAQADEILKNAGNGMPMPFGERHFFRGGPRAEILAPVAKLLNLSEADLRTQLRSGTTLTKIASQKGVSKADLVNAIKKALKAAKPEGAPSLTDQQLTQMATRIADGLGRGPGRWHGGPGDMDGDFGPGRMGIGPMGPGAGSYDPAPSTQG
jgi:hypothetical protein